MMPTEPSAAARRAAADQDRRTAQAALNDYVAACAPGRSTQGAIDALWRARAAVNAYDHLAVERSAAVEALERVRSKMPDTDRFLDMEHRGGDINWHSLMVDVRAAIDAELSRLREGTG